MIICIDGIHHDTITGDLVDGWLQVKYGHHKYVCQHTQCDSGVWSALAKMAGSSQVNNAYFNELLSKILDCDLVP